jgi:ankyrin repeat protein
VLKVNPCFEPQPLHEAIGGQQLETVKFLIDRGADLNARTYDGMGSSPLNIAKLELGLEHPITLLLQRLGAQDVESEVELEVEDDDDDDEEDDSVEYEDL